MFCQTLSKSILSHCIVEVSTCIHKQVSKTLNQSKLVFFLLNVCCGMVFYLFLCRSVCRPFCHGALKLDISTLFTTYFLQFILSCFTTNHRCDDNWQLNKLWVYTSIVLFQIVILLPVCPMQQYSTMLPHTSTPPLTAVLSDTIKQEGTLSSTATQLEVGPGTKCNAPSTVSGRQTTIYLCVYC